MISQPQGKGIAIIGNGVAGNLAAAYLRRRLPTCQITLVGREDRKRPIVGESTVEVTTHFLQALGLGEHLEEEQYHKYGLTYYFKYHADDPACRKYVVHEAPGVLRLPAYQLNRPVFDDKVRSMNRESGVVFVPKNVQDVHIGKDGSLSELHLADDFGGAQEIVHARWIVDASGRGRVLSRKLDLKKPAPCQRCCFWFRLSGFDRSVLETIITSKPKHLCFDSYYATHHFFGSHYWIWLIPLRQKDTPDLISIGITYRPDMPPNNVRSLVDFLTIIRRDHPVIAELVDTGSVVDTNFYGDYMYEARQYYSAEGWFLIGDAAFPSDPINSAGLSTLVQQIPQVGAMIEKSEKGTLSSEYVEALQDYLMVQLALQDTWGRWYEIMANPVKMAWSLVAANAAYFHIVLPAFMTGLILDGRFTRALAKRLPRLSTTPPPEPFQTLMGAVSDKFVPSSLHKYIPNMYPGVINWGLYLADNSARPSYGSRYFRVRASLRWKLMKLAGVGITSVSQFPFLIGDIIRSVLVKLFPGDLFSKKSIDHMSSPWKGDGEFLQFSKLKTASDSCLRTTKSAKVNQGT